MNIKRVALAALTTVALSSMGQSFASPRTETHAYATAIGTATVCRATEERSIPAGFGGTCFALPGTDSSVHLTITDASGPPVQGYYEFLDASGAVLVAGTFCDSGDIEVTSSFATLRVYVDGAGDEFLVTGCGIGTVGTITAEFS